jgi:hypothetical protein
MAHRIPTVNQSAAELKLQIEAERAGEPFLVLRDPGGAQRLIPLADRERLVIGREQGVDLRIDGDEAISRLHAELTRVGGSWVIADDGLSSNGTFIDGERLRTRRRLRDRDLILVGETGVLYREPATAAAVGSSGPTRAADGAAEVPALGDVQRRVLVSLCRPLLGDHAFAAAPATNATIAAELFMSIGAVKANLRALFEKFGIDDLPQNQKRAVLAEQALSRGAVHPGEAGEPP